MMLHAIVGMGNGQLMTRTTTCACNDCFLDGFNRNTTCAWNHAHIEEKAVEVVDTSSTTEHTGQEITDEIADECEQQASARSVCSSDIEDCAFVIARYDGNNYIGQVVEICPDGTYNINFMTDSGKRKGCFRWPAKEDKILRDLTDIVAVIEEPQTTTKAGRVYSVPEYVLKKYMGNILPAYTKC
ncbi:hypothetical protein DPMN_139546 [Dreissena polymorpha]|uniref:Uncharacterized protein n=1 Tax=Dreissena polymorpha TaxID=45954 RepID=A0A9D4G9R0_DREPO|nr:hypothetical protein DPMN_139546 [Dreissena polymorpha]